MVTWPPADAGGFFKPQVGKSYIFSLKKLGKVTKTP